MHDLTMSIPGAEASELQRLQESLRTDSCSMRVTVATISSKHEISSEQCTLSACGATGSLRTDFAITARFHHARGL